MKILLSLKYTKQIWNYIFIILILVPIILKIFSCQRLSNETNKMFPALFWSMEA